MYPTLTRLNAALLAPVFVATLAALLPAAPAQAAAIIGASAASANVDDAGSRTPTRLIDQSGLSRGYTSGVTDFDDYVASAKHVLRGLGQWKSASASGVLTFTFGQAVVLDGLALWSAPSEGVKDFRLLDGAGNLLGSYTGVNPTRISALAAQVFDFSAFSATSISLAFDSGYDLSATGPLFSEVAFRAGTLAPTAANTAAVPEPGSFALAGLALAGLGLTRRRRA